MKFEIGDKVYYKNKPHYVSSIFERTLVRHSCGTKPIAKVSISYDLYNEDDDEYVYDIPEIELNRKIKWDLSETYILENGSEAYIDEKDNKIHLDVGIVIPLDYYDDEGKCLFTDDFNIKEIEGEDTND